MILNERFFCWHHSGLARLNRLLEQGLIDCPRESFLEDHGLHPGDLIRVSLKVRNAARGDVVALVTLVSSQPVLLNPPLHPRYPYAVKVIVISRDPGSSCLSYPYPKPPPMNPSHWV